MLPNVSDFLNLLLTFEAVTGSFDSLAYELTVGAKRLFLLTGDPLASFSSACLSLTFCKAACNFSVFYYRVFSEFFPSLYFDLKLFRF